MSNVLLFTTKSRQTGLLFYLEMKVLVLLMSQWSVTVERSLCPAWYWWSCHIHCCYWCSLWETLTQLLASEMGFMNKNTLMYFYCARRSVSSVISLDACQVKRKRGKSSNNLKVGRVCRSDPLPSDTPKKKKSFTTNCIVPYICV